MRELIVDRGIRFFNLGPIPDPAQTARIIADLQELTRESGSLLPLVFSTDPRHSFIQADGAAHRAVGVSQWPEPLGLGRAARCRARPRVCRHRAPEYVAVGIRSALHPQVDLAYRAPLGRQVHSFGNDAADPTTPWRPIWTACSAASNSVRLRRRDAKHFPGGGPQLDGEDPHFPYGREQVYPAGGSTITCYRSAVPSRRAPPR